MTPLEFDAYIASNTNDVISMLFGHSAFNLYKAPLPMHQSLRYSRHSMQTLFLQKFR